MAKLYFRYSTMNAGKSTLLLQTAHNYAERNMRTILYTAGVDDRYGKGKITSRIGLEEDARVFDSAMDLYEEIAKSLREEGPCSCVLLDESNFLSEAQVDQLAKVSDLLGIPVLCYGLRVDFQGKAFPGSKRLLELADNLEEIKTVCHCNKKATMVVRRDAQGNAITEGAQVFIGGNDSYESLCRKHYMIATGKYPPEK